MCRGAKLVSFLVRLAFFDIFGGVFIYHIGFNFYTASYEKKLALVCDL